MGPWTRSERIGIVVILGILAALAGIGALRSALWPSPGITLRDVSPQTSSVLPSTQAADPAAAVATPEAVVHVAGAVRHPGVYRLRPEARNDDALRAAGGPNADADTDAVNLAAHVEDGTQLYFPTRQEHPHGGAASSADGPGAASTAGGARTRSGSRHRGGASHADKLGASDADRIDLNMASEQELQRLPGVGPAMAQRILDYRRENGGFRSLDDLMQVSGIGDRKFDKLKAFVRIGSETGPAQRDHAR